MSKELDRKYRKLKKIIRKSKSVLVAFSGGVDSTLVLKAARDELGEKVLAVTADSAIGSEGETEAARSLAQTIGVEHIIVETKELENPEFVKNPENKCYICKKGRYALLVKMAGEKVLHRVLDGENAEDKNDYRPGSLAARELGVISPLAEAGFSKQDIRLLSKKLSLSTWNKPSLACLASRIPVPGPITREKLKQVDRAEGFIRQMGLAKQVRVRHYDEMAKIEVEPEAIDRFLDENHRKRINDYLKELGFSHIVLDLEGYRTGKLNPVVREKQVNEEGMDS